MDTNLGPIVIATTYLPPRRPYLPYTNILRLLNNTVPISILGAFNTRHTSLGYRENNTVDKIIINLINQGKLIHLGPHFHILIRHSNSKTNPDKIFANKHHYLNYMTEPGELTTSDHLLIVFKLSATPYPIEKPKTYKITRTRTYLN